MEKSNAQRLTVYVIKERNLLSRPEVAMYGLTAASVHLFDTLLNFVEELIAWPLDLRELLHTFLVATDVQPFPRAHHGIVLEFAPDTGGLRIITIKPAM
jgi:hypothetical protein